MNVLSIIQDMFENKERYDSNYVYMEREIRRLERRAYLADQLVNTLMEPDSVTSKDIVEKLIQHLDLFEAVNVMQKHDLCPTFLSNCLAVARAERNKS